jgi:hypothetical protein
MPSPRPYKPAGAGPEQYPESYALATSVEVERPKGSSIFYIDFVQQVPRGRPTVIGGIAVPADRLGDIVAALSNVRDA